MKLACLAYDNDLQLALTPEGRQAWIKWMLDKSPKVVHAAPAEPKQPTLPDFPSNTSGMLAFSSRAASALGDGHLSHVTELAVAGHEGYQLGSPLESAREIFAKKGVEFVLPLKAKVPFAQIPSGFISTGGQLTGIGGDFLVPIELWDRLQAAGLTGLHCAAVYEVTES